MPDALRHAILGAGGIGGLLGACLAHSGATVTMVVRPGTSSEYPRQLWLESAFGSFQAEVGVAETVPAADVLWIAVKATQLASALSSVRDPALVPTIVPLLNGVDHVALLRERYGPDRVVPATIAVESESVRPGHIVHRSAFARLAVASSGRAPLAGTLDRLRTLGFECRFVDDVPTLLWSKLVFLAPVALSTTSANGPIGAVLADPDRRSRWEACVREACAVAAHEGATVDPDAVIQATQAMPPALRSSMQKDVEQHRAPELDAIAGPILRGGAHHGLPVPATRALVASVEERTRAPPSAGRTSG